MQVRLDKHHRFLEDFDNRLKDNDLKDLSHVRVKQLIKEWYNFDVEVNDAGTEAWVEMSEQNYTLFAIKYS